MREDGLSLEKKKKTQPTPKSCGIPTLKSQKRKKSQQKCEEWTQKWEKYQECGDLKTKR